MYNKLQKLTLCINLQKDDNLKFWKWGEGTRRRNEMAKRPPMSVEETQIEAEAQEEEKKRM